MISISSWWAETHRCVVRASAACGFHPSGTKISASGLLTSWRSLVSINSRASRMPSWQAGGRSTWRAGWRRRWPGRDVFPARRERGIGCARPAPGTPRAIRSGGQRKNQVAACSGSHAAQHQQIAHIVEIGVMRDGITEIDADGLVNPARALVARGHQRLHLLQFIGAAAYRRAVGFQRVRAAGPRPAARSIARPRRGRPDHSSAGASSR